MKNFWSVATDHETGLPIANCDVYVYINGGVVLATIYSDDGVTPEDNPFETDAYGRFNFYIESGIYYLKFVKDGYDTWTSDPVTIPDVVDETSSEATKNKYVSNKIIKDLMDVKLRNKKELIEFDNIQCQLPMELIRHIMGNLKSSLP